MLRPFACPFIHLPIAYVLRPSGGYASTDRSFYTPPSLRSANDYQNSRSQRNAREVECLEWLPNATFTLWLFEPTSMRSSPSETRRLLSSTASEMLIRMPKKLRKTLERITKFQRTEQIWTNRLYWLDNLFRNALVNKHHSKEISLPESAALNAFK